MEQALASFFLTHVPKKNEVFRGKVESLIPRCFFGAKAMVVDRNWI
jgi:hypothetical protein